MGSKKKSKKTEVQGPPPVSLPRRVYQSFMRLVWCSVAIVLIVYGSLHAVARTAGFKSVLANRLGDMTGVPVTITSLRADWELDLEAAGIQSEGYELAGHPGFRIEYALIDWAPLRIFSKNKLLLRSLDLKGCTFIMKPADEGGWAPAPLAESSAWLAETLRITAALPRVAPAPGLPEGQEVPVFFRWQHKYVEVNLEDSAVRWLDRTGRDAVVVEGLSLQASPIHVHGRNLNYYHLAVGFADTPQGLAARDVEYEFLKIGGEIMDLPPHPPAE